MKLTTPAALIALIPSLAFAQTCGNEPPPPGIGYGQLLNKTTTGWYTRTFLERKGNLCPCSYAETTCTIGEGENTVDCSDFVVDTQNGTQYPVVDVEYSTKVCNYNDFPIEYGKDKQNELQFWYTVNEPDENSPSSVNKGKKNERKKVFFVDKHLTSDNLNTDPPAPGECVEEKGTQELNTEISFIWSEQVLQACSSDEND